MLDIVASYHCMQFQGKLMNQTWENGKKSSFEPNFGPFGPNLDPKIFFRGFYLNWMLDIIASYHCMQLQGKLMNKTWENKKKPSFRPNFDPFGPNLGPKNFFSWILPLLDVRHCCKLSLYAISRKTNEPNLRKWQKNLVLGLILALFAQILAAIFFFKNLAPSVTKCHGQLSSCKISEKTNEAILRKLRDGRTDGPTDIPTDTRVIS